MVTMTITAPPRRARTANTPPRPTTAQESTEATRVLNVAATGALYVLPSPAPVQRVIAVYQLSHVGPRWQGSHHDTDIVQTMLAHGLVQQGAQRLHHVPNGDGHQLSPITVTTRGWKWLLLYGACSVPAQLRALSRDPVDDPTSPTGRWGGASWRTA
jgi:hypothetical protein